MKRTIKLSVLMFFIEQGRIYGFPSRVRVGKGSDGKGHRGSWAGAVSSKSSKMRKTDRPADQRTEGQSGVKSRVARD